MKVFLTLALSFTLSTHSYNHTTFTFLTPVNHVPDHVVFLVGGENAISSDWWFDDLTIYENYPDTMFIGVPQTYRLKTDIANIITYINDNYDIEQWSFVGFSLGAYETYTIALQYFSDTFNNYAAIGGGIDITLEEVPNINYFYACVGDQDMDRASTEQGYTALISNGYVKPYNAKLDILESEGHTVSEAKQGLTNFLNILANRSTNLCEIQVGGENNEEDFLYGRCNSKRTYSNQNCRRWSTRMPTI